MAETRAKATPAQKVEQARRALEDLNRGEVNPDGIAEDAVFHGVLLGDVRGRDAIVSALKMQRQDYDEFRQEPHAILADDEHTVALVNLTTRKGGQEIKAQQVIVVHDNDQGQMREIWTMFDADTMKKLAR
jgi:limonene-1,2-epoxide hydrolase